MSLTEEEYQKSIPEWCNYQTVREHYSYMLMCWGILSGKVQERGEDYCKFSCEVSKCYDGRHDSCNSNKGD